MKIGIFGLDRFSSGKENIVDPRLDRVKEMARSAKKAYVQAELVSDTQRLMECDGIIAPESNKADLILIDLEFVEKRIANADQQPERNLLNRFKTQLEKEGFIFELELSPEEKKIASSYSLLSLRPIFLVNPEDSEEKSKCLVLAYANFGYISFFTANEKEARAWPIEKGTNCWQASGLIHSDIQKGFIRAETIAFGDLVKDGGIAGARANNHLRLEGKDYIVQDGDLIKFRFNK